MNRLMLDTSQRYQPRLSFPAEADADGSTAIEFSQTQPTRVKKR
jgi:hypothetical protein